MLCDSGAQWKGQTLRYKLRNFWSIDGMCHHEAGYDPKGT